VAAAFLLLAALLVAGLSGCTSQPADTPEASAGASTSATPGAEFLRKPSPGHVRVMSFNPGWDFS
jgi:uncharacterized lipoprotein